MFDQNLIFVLFSQPDAAAEPVQEASPLFTFLPFIMIGVLFYLMIVRPQGKKQKETRAMLSNLQKNDRVITVGGIYGTVVNAPKDSDDVTLKVDDSNNTRIRVQRNSISGVISAEAGAENKSILGKR